MSFAVGATLERPHTRPLRSLLFIAGSDESPTDCLPAE